MKKIALLAGVSLSAMVMTSAAALADYTLNILHINDWHSRIESINRFGSTCSAEDETEGKCFGGAARLKTAIDQRRAALDGQNVVFMNAGDNFQGSLFYSTYKGSVEAEMLEVIGTDVMAVGNHEFDDGEEGLAAFLDRVSFPVLGANIAAGANTKIGNRVKPYTVMDIGGDKIGVVGVVAADTDELSSPGDSVLILDDIEATRTSVEALQAEGVNKIVLLSHVGLERDKQIAEAVPGIDVIVGGHSHTLLSNMEEGASSYPEFLLGPSGSLVPIVQVGSNSKYLGELKVTFDDAGEVTSATGDAILLDKSFEPDARVAARVKDLGGPIEELKKKLVGETFADIDGSRENCRARECEMGNLVADAMLTRVADQGIQIAIQNGGGLRASIDAGDITMGEVLTVLPFQNTLSTFQLSGKDIVASLEGGVSQIEEGKGRFPQVSGLKYTFDTSVAPNEGRISDVQVWENGEWKPIEGDKVYGVVTNDFMRRGGDGYKLFAENGMNAYDYGPGLEEVLANYLDFNRPYEPPALGARITDASATKDEMKEEEAEADPDPTKSDAASTEMTKEEPKAEMAEEKPAEGMKEKMEGKEMPVDTTKQEEAEADSDPMKSGTENAEMKKEASEAKMEMKGTVYTIVRGDNLWDLARKFYGDARMWEKLTAANPSLNPNNLVIGTQITVPAAN